MMHIHGFMTSLLICLGYVAIKVDVVHGEVRSASACHNSGTAACNFMTLECNAGTTIRLLTMKYGVKTDKCNGRRNECLKTNRNGCCVYEDSDCTEYYNQLHAFILHKQCSGKQLCEDLSVPNKVLSTCDGETSTYVQVDYECVPDTSFGDFCDSSQAGNDINLLFKSDTSTLNGKSYCTCLVQSPTGVIVEYVDVRMFKDNNQTWASLCSSASLVSDPESTVDTFCDEQLSEQENFIHAKSWEGPSIVQIKLINLHSLGPVDQPGFIWLNLIGTEQVSMSVTCFQHADFNPTTPVVVPVTTSQGLSSSGTTDINSAPLDDDSSNNGAIVAGVLIPIIIILVICIVLFIIWKRRGYLFKRASTKSRSTPNTYLDGTDIENSIENEEYAEIGFVPDEPNMSPAYDTVYEPRVKPSTTGTNNSTTPTYVNTSNVNKAHKNNVTITEQKEKKSKNLKFPFDKMKSSKDRLISFFKKQGETDFPSAKPEKKSSCDKTEESYDHLRPTSVCSGVQIELLTPTDDPKHTYSRTSDIPVTTNTVSVETKRSALTTKLNAKSGHDEINAVHVGDAYIEFQRGPMDKDHPNLIKTPNQEHDPNDRPNPPSRPPPSPGKGKRKDGYDVSNDALIRSNSPNHLSPVPVGSRSVSPVGSEVSSNHSYKVLEPQAVYDYADLSDDELGVAPHPPEELYEDVDGRKLSVRKPVSVSVIPDEDDEYLEPVPRTASTAALPESNEQPKGMAKREAPKSQFSLLKRELKEKMDRNQGNKPNESVTANANKGAKNKTNKVTKTGDSISGRLEERDKKVNGVKGVLNMAKMFESDSDSSRQSSPRDIQINKDNRSSNDAKLKARWTSSDA